MTDTPYQIQFIDADRRPGIEQMLHQFLPWMVGPERSFYCALLEGHDAEATLQRWIGSTDSELSLYKTRLLVANDRIAGGFTGFAGRQLQRRRETDLVDLVRETGRTRSSKLRRRLRDLMPLFAPVAPADFYVSKFGLSPGLTHEDLEKELVEECIKRADDAGHERIRIDIDADNRRTHQLLSDSGFKVFDRGHANEARITYLNMIRHI